MVSSVPCSRPRVSRTTSSRWIKLAMLSLKLEPVTFHYKKDLDPDRIIQFGLIAEQVGKIDPELVVRDDDDKVTTVATKQSTLYCSMNFLKSIARSRNSRPRRRNSSKQLRNSKRILR